MKKKWFIFLCCAIMICLAACSSTSADKKVSTNGTIIVGTEAGFAPYEYLEGDQVVGIDMDIAQAIADAAGKKCLS